MGETAWVKIGRSRLFAWSDFRFCSGMSPPGTLDDLSPAELKALVIRLMGDITELRRGIEDQRAAIARLEGGKRRPRVKPGKPGGLEEGGFCQAIPPRPRGGGPPTP